MLNEIQLYKDLPDKMAAIKGLGLMMARSGMFGCEKQEAGEVLALICLSENTTPTQLLRRYDIINGRLSIKAAAALADFRKAGGKHKWLDTGDSGEGDARKAQGEFTFDGQTLVVTYTMSDARRAGLIKRDSNWEKNPAQMLRARCEKNAVMMLAPEIFAGDDSESPITSAEIKLPSVVVTEAPKTASAPLEIIQEATIIPMVEKPAATKQDTEKELADAGLAPVIFKAEAGPDGKLTKATFDSLVKVITNGATDPGARMDAVIYALTTKKAIADSNLYTLRVDRAQKALNDPAAMLRNLGVTV